MKIAIIGANGRTGRRVLERALERGHQVVAVVRDPAKLGTPPVGVRVVAADARDIDGQTDALRGVDAVVSALGPNKTSGENVLTTGIDATLRAVADAGPRRLVVVSASGHTTVGDAPLVRTIVKPILNRIIRTSYADMRTMERHVIASDRDWTIVRPPMLTEKPARGGYQSRIGLNVRRGFTMTRADLATAILDVLENDGTVGQIVSVAN